MEALLPYLVGPGAAVISLLLVMFGAYKLLKETIIPTWNNHIDKILDEHRKDRKLFIDAVEILDKRLDTVEFEVSEMRKELKDEKQRRNST
jgi:hypothetical protein